MKISSEALSSLFSFSCCPYHQMIPPSRKNILFSSSMLVGIIFIFSTCHAAEIRWTGGSSGNWAEPSSWSSSVLPTALDNVTISNATVIATISSSCEAASLVLQENSRLEIQTNTSFNIQNITIFDQSSFAPADWLMVDFLQMYGGQVESLASSTNNTLYISNQLYVDSGNTSGVHFNNINLTLANSATAFMQGNINIAFLNITEDSSASLGSSNMIAANNISLGTLINSGDLEIVSATNLEIREKMVFVDDDGDGAAVGSFNSNAFLALMLACPGIILFFSLHLLLSIYIYFNSNVFCLICRCFNE